MRDSLKLVFIILLFISCKDLKKDEFITTEARILVGFRLNTYFKNNPIQLTRIENDSTIIFKYRNLADSTRILKFLYEKNKDRIWHDQIQFQLTTKQIQFSNIRFTKYEGDINIDDGMGPILFNEKYGILAWDSGWGTQNHYLTKENFDELNLPIIFNINDLVE